MRYCIIIYFCVPCFCFHSKSLLFTPNPGHYTPKSLCSSPNGLLFTSKSSSGNVPMSAVPYIHCGVGGCCARKEHCAKLEGGVDSNGWVCIDVCIHILARDIECAKPSPEPDSQYGSWVCEGLGTRAPWSILE